jgi:hypothetical protein
MNFIFISKRMSDTLPSNISTRVRHIPVVPIVREDNTHIDKDDDDSAKNSSMGHHDNGVKNSSMGHNDNGAKNSSMGHNDNGVKNSSMDHNDNGVKNNQLKENTSSGETLKLHRQLTDLISEGNRELTNNYEYKCVDGSEDTSKK